jgi:hypothetical protein
MIFSILMSTLNQHLHETYIKGPVHFFMVKGVTNAGTNVMLELSCSFLPAALVNCSTADFLPLCLGSPYGFFNGESEWLLSALARFGLIFCFLFVVGDSRSERHCIDIEAKASRWYLKTRLGAMEL